MAKIISIEGVEGCGKSTQFLRLEQYLIKKGYQVKSFREPGETPVGEKIRDILLDPTVKMSSLCEALLYISSRIEVVEEIIKPNLEKVDIFLADRYLDSTLVYQGVAAGVGFDMIYQLLSELMGDFFPDLTIVLDVPVDIGFSRKSSPRDRIEQRDYDYHNRVRNGYLLLKDKFPERIRILDGTLSEDEVFDGIKDLVQDYLCVGTE